MFQKIRELSKNLAIYGAGDVAISLVNFLLLPVYVDYLTKYDYGVLALLGAVEVVAKIAFRCGLDGSFMRFFYDCDDDRGRQRLASTIFFFLLALNGVLLAAALLAAPWLGQKIFRDPRQTLALQLVLLNTFAIGFTFIPFHVLRMEKRSMEFSALTLARSISTVVLRIVLIVGAGLGLLGVVVADVVVTAGLILLLVPRFAPLIRPAFSTAVLRDALRFGLPRVPHAAAQQVVAVGDKFIMSFLRVPSDVIGLYSMGVSFGLTQKLFLSAFEYAWAPFYYATARERDAPAVFRTVTTYGIATLALITAGLSATARDLLNLMTKGLFVDAAPVVAWTAIGVLFQGIYLLTSIGLNITKRTEFYAVATLAAAGASVGLNFLFIPRYGILGAAWANAAAYALQAVVAFRFSQRFYHVEYEYGRIVRVLAAATAAFLVARAIPTMHPVAGIAARGVTVVAIFGVVLWAARFFGAEELAVLRRLARRRAVGAAPIAPPETTELGGEIVAAELPDERLAVGGGSVAVEGPRDRLRG